MSMSVSQTPAFGFGKFPNGSKEKALVNKMLLFYLRDGNIENLPNAKKKAGAFIGKKIARCETQETHDNAVSSYSDLFYKKLQEMVAKREAKLLEKVENNLQALSQEARTLFVKKIAAEAKEGSLKAYA